MNCNNTINSTYIYEAVKHTTDKLFHDKPEQVDGALSSEDNPNLLSIDQVVHGV